MRSSIVVPDLGAGSECLKVSGWLVDEGDWILAGDLVVEVLIPGLTFDIAAESTGRLVEIVAAIDTTIRAGDVLGWIDDSTGAANVETDDPSTNRVFRNS